MSRRQDKGRLPPFVPLILTTIDSRAWKALSHGARSLYVALRRRYSSQLHNNGRIYLSQRVAAKEIGSHHNEIARWFRVLQFYGFIVMTKGGSLGVEGKGKAPHWRLTELGYMNELPTRDFERWTGAKFTDQKTKPRAPFPSHTAREMAHTQVREMAHTNRRNRDGNGAHTAATDSAGIRHIPSSTTPPAEIAEPMGSRLYARAFSAGRPSGGAPNAPASARSAAGGQVKKEDRERSEQVSGAACSDRAVGSGESARSHDGRLAEVKTEAKHARPSAVFVSKRNSEPLRGGTDHRRAAVGRP
jgi:hypothetical protein